MKLDLRFEKRDCYSHLCVLLLCSKCADDVNVAPNIGYGLIIAKASAAQ